MAAARCPVCGRPVTAAARPFCSRRCADVDLGRWLTGQYVLPGPPVGEEDAPAQESPERDAEAPDGTVPFPAGRRLDRGSGMG